MANLSIGFQDDSLLDDDLLLFGSDDDYSIRYDSTEDELVIEDEVANNQLLNFGRSEIVFNEDGADLNFRVESLAETGMLFVDAAENQCVIHGTADPDYGALFAHGRATGSGADNDVVATLGEDDENIQLNGNNTGIVQNVQVQAGNWQSSNAVSPDIAANLRVEGVPTFGTNVTPSNVYSFLVQNRDATKDWFRVDNAGNVEVPTGDILDGGGNVVYSQANNWVPQTRLENDSITVTAGDGIKGGGTVALGSSTTVNIEPANFAGTFLSDDGADNLTVDIGRGLENDGSGNIQFDEDTSYTFTVGQNFSAGLDTQGDITDGTQIIWDVSAQEIPDSAMGTIGDATLADPRTDISDSGTSVLSDVTDINFASNLSATDDGDGSVTVDAVGGSTAASTTDDGSDVTEYSASRVTSNTTVVNITGSGFLLAGWAQDQNGGSVPYGLLDVTVDGGTTFTVTARKIYDGGQTYGMADVFPIKFDSSLKVVVTPQDGATAQLFVKQ